MTLYLYQIGIIAACSVAAGIVFAWLLFKKRRSSDSREISNLRDAIQACESERKGYASRFNAVFNQSFEFMAILDVQGRLLTVNETVLKFVGIQEEETRGAYIWERPWWTSAQDRDSVRKGVGLAAVGEVNRYEYIVENRAGRRINIDFSIKPIRDEKGQVVQLLAEARDVTQRRDAITKLEQSERTFRTAIEKSSVGMALVGLDGSWIKVNQAISNMLGYSENELLKLRFQDITHKDDLEADLGHVQELLDNKATSYQMEKRYIHKQGHEVTAMLSVSIVRDHEEVPLFFIAQIQDVTEQRKQSRELRQTNDRLILTIEELQRHSDDMKLLKEVTDQLQACENSKEACDVISSFGDHLFPGCSGAIALHNSSRNAVEIQSSWGKVALGHDIFAPNDCWALRRGRAYWRKGEGLICPHLQDEAPENYVCFPFIAQSEIIGLLHLECVPELFGDEILFEQLVRKATMITEHIGLAFANLRLRQVLERQSIRDPLTGLYNRRYMEESLNRELLRCRRHNRQLSIMMLDIDHFKRFNDDYGHQAGDFVLEKVGEILASKIRGDDIACRFGGEEFCIIMPEASLDSAARRAEELRILVGELDAEFRGEHLGHLTISIGISERRPSDHLGDDIIRRADAALYKAKRDGRDQVALDLNSENSAGER